MRGSLRAFFIAAVVLGIGVSAAAPAAQMAAPVSTKPSSGAVVASLPAFGWRAVAGADHYEFEIAADRGFSSPVSGNGHAFSTQNTWATLRDTIPNGTYWWHARAVSSSGAVSSWSAPRSIRKQWKATPALLSPASGTDIKFPITPFVLRWSPVPYAVSYFVYLATDSALVSLVGSKPVETHGVSYSPSVALANRTYYWAVVPVDAGGNRGARSRIASFTWVWDSRTTLAVNDLVSATEQFDPQFSWKPVPGAARYEIEINPSHEWSVGSKVCCKDPVVTTTFSPMKPLLNNRYYWRVRAINVDGNAGTWNEGPSFTKVFDNFGDPEVPTVKNVRIEDNYGAVGGPGFATNSPIVAWDPVPGAAVYELDVVSFLSGTCDWTKPGSSPDAKVWRGWHGFTAVPAWTPAADAKTSPPYSAPKISSNGHDSKGATQDGGSAELIPGSYCLRIRAHSDNSVEGTDIYGNYTYFPDPTNLAFTFTGYPLCACAQGPGDSYSQPAQGQAAHWTPVFRWKAIAGAAGYWIIVSKDRSFTTIVDYAFTRIPAWAPRDGDKPWTYTDEETEYYWAVLPSAADGRTSVIDPNFVPSTAFLKQSTPASILVPSKDGRVIVGPPTFHWTPVPNALSYELQVSGDRSFETPLDDQFTDSTAYTSTKTYPANAALYFRVRADDGRKVGLSWSVTRRFRNTLPAPNPGANNPRSGDLIPAWTWSPVQGAHSYDIHVDLPNGSSRDFSNDLLTAFTATTLTGTGVFHWQVRAEFPEAHGGATAVGPYSRRVVFTRTIRPPEGPHALIGAPSLLLIWNPKVGTDHYHVQVSTTPDFSHTVEDDSTDNTSIAPDLRNGNWSKSSLFYWRVLAVDADGNSGNDAPVHTFRAHFPVR